MGNAQGGRKLRHADAFKPDQTLAFSSSMASSFETPAQAAAPQDEVLNPRGEERGNAARLEP
jgi:hypothetical protein